MERNIGDQLNKAFEAYRQVSIEKDNAKKELQQMVTTRGEQTLCEAGPNIANAAQIISCRLACIARFTRKVFVTDLLKVCLLILFLLTFKQQEYVYENVAHTAVQA